MTKSRPRHPKPAIEKAVQYAEHRHTYPAYWRWSQAAVDHAMLFRRLHTVIGWNLFVGLDANPRSLANFPCQANGAEMLRLACCLIVERGIQLLAPNHDAVMVEGPAEDIDAVVAETQAAMCEAGRIILDGFELRTDAEVVVYPDRYEDERGVVMWDQVNGILADLIRQNSNANRNEGTPDDFLLCARNVPPDTPETGPGF